MNYTEFSYDARWIGIKFYVTVNCVEASNY